MRISRDDLAIATCILSVGAFGLAYFAHHLDAVDVFDWLWIVWFVVAEWLSGRWRRTLNLPVRGIYQATKRGSLQLTGTALMIERASSVFFVAMVVSWLMMHHWS